MKPIKLTIFGVKSFSEAVVIDFKEVTKSGLFGIFGDTGSGKSTILDSIICALYSTKFKSEYINKRCKNAEIDYEFQIVFNGVRKVYKVNRKYSLTSASKSVLYEVINENDKIVLAEKQRQVDEKIIEIIGLNADEFESSIVLPQGKFDKFLTSPRINRVKIMESLFGLEKYGEKLKKNTGALRDSYAIKQTELTAKLSMLNSVNLDALNDLKSELKIALKEYEELNAENSKILDYIEKNTVFYNLKSRRNEVESSLIKLRQKEDYFTNAKSVINKLFLIKNFIDLNAQLNALNGDILSLTNKVVEFKKLYDNSVIKQDSLKQNIASKKTQLERLNCTLNNAEINYEKSKLIVEQNQVLNQTVKNNFTQILSLKNQIENTSAELNKVQNLIKNYTSNGATYSLEKHLKELENSISKKAVNTQINSECKFLNDLLNLVIENKPKTAILSRLENLSNALKDSDEYKDEFLLISEVKTAFDVQREVQLKINELSTNKQALISKLETLNAKVNELESNNLDILKQVSKNDALILTLTDGKDVKSQVLQLKESVAKLKQELLSSEDLLSQAETCVLNSTLQINEVKTKLDGLILQKTKVEGDVLKLKNEVGYSLEESVKIVKEYDLETLKQDTENYFEEVLLLTNELTRIDKNLKNSTFELSIYQENLQKREEIHKKLLLQAEKTAKIKNSCEKTEQNYKDKCIIEKEYNILYEKIKLLDSLIAIVKERKLLEFIAEEYLKEICAKARKTLFKLSSGKYGLVYDGEFFITDNLNGGEKRAVITLSGGETFIVSLSLALALSQEIHSASLRPIEFFFLDEGFGTLDKNLTDTVISSLQKLKNPNFTIGLISHVDELKDAVDGKIEVTSATQTSGSKVKVSVGY